MALRQKVRAILIDPYDMNVGYVETGTHIDDMSKWIGGLLQIGHVLPSGDVLYVDEEGLTKDLTPGPDRKATVFCIHAHQVFAGRGLIVGDEVNGIITDVVTTLPEIKFRTQFGFAQ